MPKRFAVVIPYYQKERGVLGRALESIGRQRGVDDVRVIVVDDSSPIVANDEIGALTLPPFVRVECVRRANGGPAAARNTGLGRVPDDVDCVAFLDSDDQWSDDHLMRSTLALSQGFDFYFADLMQLDQTTSAFKRGGRIVASAHRTLLPGEDLYAFNGDMFDQIMRGNVIGTSTVVFDRARFPMARFREEYYSAGEDYLCWMDFARGGARFAFSTRCEAVYGRGVNIYSGARWGTSQHLERVHNEYRYRRATMTLHPVNDQQAAHLRAAMSTLRDEFALDLLHMLRHGEAPALGVLRRQVAIDPRTLIHPMVLAMRRVLRLAVR
jgi:succinoglycan biosynthesis protein ExoW